MRFLKKQKILVAVFFTLIILLITGRSLALALTPAEQATAEGTNPAAATSPAPSPGLTGNQGPTAEQAVAENGTTPPGTAPAPGGGGGGGGSSGGFIDWISGKAFGAVAYYTGYVAGYIAGTLFWFGGLLIQLALSLNDRLLSDGSIVYAGWPIILSITNLGFVLAIIVMAFATIFRLESYAWKQTLWKLIVAALLVNFSLLIAGAFINIASIFTNFFIGHSLPNGVADIGKFSEALASMFKAQQFLQSTQATNPLGSVDKSVLGTFGGQLLSLVAQLFFIAAFTFIAAITLLALAIMLLIRYIALALLLILSPIVWLLWIFPATKKYWTDWWKRFLRWTFFAPAVSLFLYLAMLAIVKNAAYLTKIADDLQKSGGAAQYNAFTAGGGFTTGSLVLSTVANLVVVIGLLLGGLFVANSMGIAFADTAYGWAKSAGKGFGGWAGRKGIRAGTRPFRGPLGTKAVEWMAQSGANKMWPLKTIAWPVRQLGAQLSRLGATGAEKLVSDAEKRLPADDYRLAKMIHTLTPEEQIAALQRLRKNKSMDLIPDASAFINKETKARWIRYGQPAPDFTNMERTVGFNIDMLRAAREGSFTRTNPDGTKETVSLQSAAEKFYKGYRPEHFTKMQVDEFFGKYSRDGSFGLDQATLENIQKEAVKAILETNPDGLANIYRNIKGVNRDNFHNNLLVPYLRAQAAAAHAPDVMTWLKNTHPSLHTFFDSSSARSLGITV